jgi:hypothetical protein
MPCGRKRPRTATDLEGTQWEDAPLGELARAITAEVASLQRLGASVIGGEVSTGQHDSGSSVRAGWEHCPESKAPCSGLRSRAERLGLKRGPRFSLANVAAQLTEATVHAAPRLDLPNFSKMQRQQACRPCRLPRLSGAALVCTHPAVTSLSDCNLSASAHTCDCVVTGEPTRLLCYQTSVCPAERLCQAGPHTAQLAH